MKKTLCFILVFMLFGSCKAQKIANNVKPKVEGFYKQKSSGEKLEFKPDGSFFLHNAAITFTPVIEQCEYASKGRWNTISDDVIEITSENYYQQQEGFKYELKRENKFSQDSLYIEVNLPKDFLYFRDKVVNNYFSFNYDKRIETNETFIKIPKNKYLWTKNIPKNNVIFRLNANISGTTLYNSRILFEIFEEDIDTEKYNYLTITLPNFDLCFFEFEPYNQELIFVKNEKELIWQGKNWKKID